MGHGASTSKWMETPGVLFEDIPTESELTSGSEVSMPWLPADNEENSQENFFTNTRLVSVLSTDSEPRVVRETGLDDLFDQTPQPKKRGTGRLLNKLAAKPRAESPDSLGRVTPLQDNSDSGLDSDEEPTHSRLRGGYSLSQSPQIRRKQHQLGFISSSFDLDEKEYVL
ncbi:hypothetical protein ACHWQZ_G006247 [Mnemiopsis leidyi]